MITSEVNADIYLWNSVGRRLSNSGMITFMKINREHQSRGEQWKLKVNRNDYKYLL